MAGCASASPEQAETERLMWDAARECQGRFATIQSIDRIDSYGRLHFTHHGSGHENTAFLQCVQDRFDARARAAVPPERVVLDQGASARVVVAARASDGAFIVPVRINGAVDTRLLVDTGSNVTLLSPDVAARLGLPITAQTRRSALTLAGGREVTIPRVRLASVKLGGASVENLYAGVFDALPHIKDVDGILGTDFLRHFRVSIDQRRERLVLDAME
jgi:clan AA aspartic protease (TIGR02281 family)